MGLVQRAIDTWLVTPRWWKGFYIVFVLGFVVLAGATGDGRYAALWAFVWALMVAFSLWGSERIKARRRGPEAPQVPTSRDVRGPRSRR